MEPETLYQRFVNSVKLFLAVWLIGAIGFYFIGVIYENPDIGDTADRFSLLNCFYMSAITVTTVGYGEVTGIHTTLLPPGPAIGTTFTMVFCLASYFAVLYATGNILAALVEGTLGKLRLQRRMEKKLASLEGHFIVCGAGSTGRHVIDELLKTGHSVVVIDRNEHDGEAWFKNERSFLIVGDATDDEVLERAGLSRARGIFASLQDDKDNLFISLSAAQTNDKIRIVGRATEFGSVSKLKAVGAQAVVSPNHIGGLRMASEMIRPGVVTFLDTMLRSTDSSLRFSEIRVDESMEACNRPLNELHTFDAVGLNVIGIFREDRSIVYNPPGDTMVKAGDALIVICDKDALKRMEEHARSGVRRFHEKFAKA
ncbi:MAG: potassium channel protein [Planctomycetes bacterium]|nr:potassium channel protein [Planctomycetota bacterium]